MPRWSDENRTPLARLRTKAGFTREEASAILRIVTMTLYRYEIGKNDIPLGLAEDMSVLYNVSFDELRAAVKETKELHKEKRSAKSRLQDVINADVDKVD